MQSQDFFKSLASVRLLRIAKEGIPTLPPALATNQLTALGH